MTRYATLWLLLAAALSFTAISTGQSKVAPTPAEGVLPVGADGKPLNLDFETGTLKDWKAEGDAFAGQPIKGDTVAPRRGDMKSQHQGNYWIGTYERQGDKPQGTLTSVPFKVTHPWASFLVAGGPWPETCVELVRNDTQEVFSRTSGAEEENLRRVAIDLHGQLDKEIFIRLVDRHSGHWGHINFDDFRFHPEKPNVPARPNQAPPFDQVKYAGLPPEQAAQVMTVPPGFEVKLFAGEPDIVQPIAFCIDDRGRLWVAEANSYPIRRADKDARDRILIFEDEKGEGHFTKRTVFMEGLNLVSGLEVGFGGVWIGAAPYLMYVPIKEGEDKPAGPPQILLDGWHYEDTHETLNAFMWGPDGWLYGCHGVFTHSRVGKPGTPDDQRIPINAGVWRYHPTKHIFEVFAHGTSNPWGLDFDEHGQMFIEACVVTHAFHIVQGGRYDRQAGEHFNKHTYADIKTIADHLHWQGANQWAGNNRSDSMGGGHAHCGLMIYQGGAWPQEFCNNLIIGNVHGHRFNMDILKPKGSSFVASHGPDFIHANDAWARFINIKSGPDGNAYFLDWYDKQACHLPTPEVWDRSNGRIYKICYRGTEGASKASAKVDLAKLSDKELVELQTHKNDWYARHARRILQERYSDPTIRSPAKGDVMDSLEKNALFSNAPTSHRLRSLWALNSVQGLIKSSVNEGLHNRDPYVRAWTIQLAVESRKESLDLNWLATLAVKDSSPVVKLYLASALQRLPHSDCWPILEGLLTHPEDANDPNLPLMYWYAAEPLADADPSRALELAAHARIPILLPFMVRRVASAATPEALALVVKLLTKEGDSSRQLAILHGINDALKGRRQVAMPGEWSDMFAKLSQSKNADIRAQATALAVTFGDPKAFGELRRVLKSRDADLPSRHSALAALLGARDKELPPVLDELLKDNSLRGAAIRGLASYDDPNTPELVLAAYPTLSAEEKRDALNTLASRAGYGKLLMDAVAAKKVPASDVPAEIVRQLRNLRDEALDKRIAEVWGIVRATPADRARLIADWKRKLNAQVQAPDLALGRAIFAKTCQQCHTLYGIGGKVGPDITGSNRGNLDYLLENILDPSAVIPNDYKATVFALKNGRIVTGIVRGETPAAFTVITQNEMLTIPRDEVDDHKVSDVSMMPDDILKSVNETEFRALVAYLRNPNQTQILATPDNAKDFFNGKDLAGWDGNPKLWSVENGEIVGKSPGIPKNEFLKSQMVATDFRLALKVKLTPNKENSGVQFRSEPLPDGEMKGPQADIGQGWWGKLYEENGRGVIHNNPGEKHVKPDEWNDYEIIAQGSHIKTFINGKPCVDLDDPQVSRRGIFGLQIHAGGPMEVRFRDIKFEVLTERTATAK